MDTFEPIQFLKIAGSFVISASLALYLTPLIRKGAIDYQILRAKGENSLSCQLVRRPGPPADS